MGELPGRPNAFRFKNAGRRCNADHGLVWPVRQNANLAGKAVTAITAEGASKSDRMLGTLVVCASCQDGLDAALQR
jgi:hypothetical protein